MVISKKTTAEIIINTLIKSHTPLNLYKLEQATKLSHQRIAYTLPKLIQDGLVVPIQNGQNTKYALQLVHTQKEVIKNLLPLIEPLIKKVYFKLNLEYATNKEIALANNVALFISKQIVNLK